MGRIPLWSKGSLSQRPWVRLPVVPLFFSCTLPFQRSTDSDSPDCVFQLDTIAIDLRTIEESRPSDSSPCCDYACDLSYINYAQSSPG